MSNFYEYQVFIDGECSPSVEFHTAVTLRNRLTWLAVNTAAKYIRLVRDGDGWIVNLDTLR